MFTCRLTFPVFNRGSSRFLVRSYAQQHTLQKPKIMGKNTKKSRSAVPAEENLILPAHSSGYTAGIVDTHTHLSSTYSLYRSKYLEAKHTTIFEFFRAMSNGKNVRSVVDVWCEAPVQKLWKELADSALTEESRKANWDGIDYWFVMGVHPHEAKLYDNTVERDIVEAMAHPRCVGWGEIGLDYHYDNSPRDIQRAVLARQLQRAVELGKPLTIHTREAEEDTERLLKEHVPKDHKIHIHCFTDSPEFATRLMDHFPNLYIGVTGVITYSANLNTTATLKSMASNPRILLETDGPYMVPANLYNSLSGVTRLPLCHTAMIPWTAEFVANILGEGWDADKVLTIAQENAKHVYGV